MKSKRIKEIMQAMRRENRKWPPTPKPISKKDWPKGGPEEKRMAVWRSRDFLIQAFTEKDGFIRLSINRTMLRSDGRWRDDISWDELQRIKSLIGFGECLAVEVFPADTDIVNVANMRHLWIFPDRNALEFVWKGSDGSSRKNNN